MASCLTYCLLNFFIYLNIYLFTSLKGKWERVKDIERDLLSAGSLSKCLVTIEVGPEDCNSGSSTWMTGTYLPEPTPASHSVYINRKLELRVEPKLKIKHSDMACGHFNCWAKCPLHVWFLYHCFSIIFFCHYHHLTTEIFFCFFSNSPPKALS